ncbi:hypothetical protein [Pedobacter westerhofensis]
MNQHIVAKITSFLKVVTVQSIFFIQIASCQGFNHKKYDWIPTECAPKDYPAQIYSGHFYYGDKGSVYVPDGREEFLFKELKVKSFYR